MAMTGYTCFFSGSSSDQGPDILRHLNFGTHNYFGTSLWSAWRVLPRVDDPVYFTVSAGHARYGDGEIEYGTVADI